MDKDTRADMRARRRFRRQRRKKQRALRDMARMGQELGLKTDRISIKPGGNR